MKLPFFNKKRAPETSAPIPAIPETEAGKNAFRVNLWGKQIAYLFTPSPKLSDAVFHPENVSFVCTDRSNSAAQAAEPEMVTLTEKRDYGATSDFDDAAAKACRGMTVDDAAKVVVFFDARPNNITCAHKTVETLCDAFGATLHPEGGRPKEVPPRPALRLVQQGRKTDYNDFNLCG